MLPNPVGALVAKDVLEHLIPNPKVTFEPKTYLRLTRRPETCVVCGLGAVVLACFHVEGLAQHLPDIKEREREIRNELDFDNTGGTCNDHLFPILEAAFSKKQLGLIEAAFECALRGRYANAYIFSVELYAHEVDDDRRHCAPADAIYQHLSKEDHEHFHDLLLAKRFGRRHKDPEERLAAIMQNIVENNGVFIPG